MNTLLIAFGGGLGAMLRYLLGSLVDSKGKRDTMPLAILAINVLGAGGLGIFLGYRYDTISYNFYSCSAYLCFGVGFFGAFTTFSTFSIEAISLLQRKAYKSFLLYILFTIVGSITAFTFAFLLIQ